jgi:hypothetical protein
MGIKSYLNFLSGGNIIEPTYDNFTRNTVQITSISATGGTTVDDAGFRIHVFTSPGSFVVSSAGPGTVEYVVVAGGGGGGVDYFQSAPRFGSGGGAGGLRTNFPGIVNGASNPLTGGDFPITAGTYPITVGGGGAGGITAAFQVSGSQGSPSIFNTITSTGGGGGAGHNPGPTGPTPPPGTPGGSGGGGAPATNAGNDPPVSPPQGNPGGTTDAFSGSGGGGAGARGFNSPTTGFGNSVSEPGVGGIGVKFDSIPASYGTPGPAPGRYFAGGGGAAPQNTSGGSGGGGPGNGTSGTTNTGGGGGARFQATAGSGGSGIVIIRYPI